MIANFSDHAANERTFLAWVRTAIAVMAFGFLVAKFNNFLQIAAQLPASRDGRAVVMHAGGFGDLLLAALMLLLGVALAVYLAVTLAGTS